MHEMQPIITDVRDVCLSVSLSVCLSRAAQLGFTVQKKAKQINILSGVNTLEAQRTLC